LHFSTLKNKNHIITITGPSPGVGKSFISANLAAVLAQSDKKVLLIDTDMRKGTLEKYFATDAIAGLSDYLANELERESVIKKTELTKLDFISRGKVPPNPAELLMQPRLQSLLEWAKENYDWIIIDSPPILAVTDAGILAAFSGSTLMVGAFAQTNAREIKAAKNKFEQSKVHVSGFILNRIQKRVSNRYYNNHYYYQYEQNANTNSQGLITKMKNKLAGLLN
jgi:tyrosine-protein kinase Etk/Wzc